MENSEIKKMIREAVKDRSLCLNTFQLTEGNCCRQEANRRLATLAFKKSDDFAQYVGYMRAIQLYELSNNDPEGKKRAYAAKQALRLLIANNLGTIEDRVGLMKYITDYKDN